MALNSDDPLGCLGIAKALEIGRSPRSGCTKALEHRLRDFLLGVSHRWRQLWSLEFSESVDRRSIHQLAATCKTNKKTTVVFCRPSDGKVSLFLEDLELRVAVTRLKISYLIWCDLLLFYVGRKEDPSFLESRPFLPIMLGEGDSYFGKGDLFFPLRYCLPDITTAKRAFLFC